MPDGIRLPGAIWRPFTNRTVSSLPWKEPGAIIGHTMGYGTRGGSWNYHNDPGMPYTQLYYDQHGVPYQVTGLEYRSAGTLELNPYVIAMEVADAGPGFPEWDRRCGNVPPMTDAQVAGLIRDCAWMCVALGIEPRELADSCEATTVGGIGWHRQGIDHWRKPGCPKTSNSYGKCCPDESRISQWRREIIPDVRQIVLNQPTGEFTVDAEAKAYFDRIIASLTRVENDPLGPTVRATAGRVNPQVPRPFLAVPEGYTGGPVCWVGPDGRALQFAQGGPLHLMFREGHKLWTGSDIATRLDPEAYAALPKTQV